MEQVKINPANYEKAYLKNLNLCFPGWGEAGAYNWTFKRAVEVKLPDILIIQDNGNTFAGSGISYRKLVGPGNNSADIGIMTGSWTLPEARGKGAFSKIIEESALLCAKNDVPFLTAFVMESNPSFRRLKEAGSALIPTYTFFSSPGLYQTVETLNIQKIEYSDSIAAQLYERFKKANQSSLHFNYSFGTFKEQYLLRHRHAELLLIDDEMAVVEETPNIIKVLYYSGADRRLMHIRALSNWMVTNRKKNLLLFTTVEKIAGLYEREGMECMPGYFTVYPTIEGKNRSEFDFSGINIQMADKM